MAPHWQPGRYLLPLSPFQWVCFTPSTSPTRCQVSDSFRCGVGLRACDGEVPRNVSPSTWPMLNLVDLDDSELVWPNTRELTKPPNNPQPKKKQTNKQTSNLLGFCNWAKLGIQKFLTCWGLDWYQKCKEDQPLKSKQIKHKASTFNSAAAFAKPKNKTAHNVLLHHLLQFSCFTNTSASIIRQVTIAYPSRKIPHRPWILESSLFACETSQWLAGQEISGRKVSPKKGRWRMSQNKFVSWPKFEIQTQMERCKFWLIPQISLE